MKTILTLIMVLGFTSVSYADVFDRIDACENSGGGSCVYDLLREIAQSSSGPAFILPAAGPYKKTSGSSILCADQTLTPLFTNGRLSQIRVSWCRYTTSTDFDCHQNVCANDTSSFEILSRTSYRFNTSDGKSAIYEFRQSR